MAVYIQGLLCRSNFDFEAFTSVKKTKICNKSMKAFS